MNTFQSLSSSIDSAAALMKLYSAGYNSGARLSEMTSMRCGQVRFDSTTYLQLHGKGRKERVVPLWRKCPVLSLPYGPFRNVKATLDQAIVRRRRNSASQIMARVHIVRER